MSLTLAQHRINVDPFPVYGLRGEGMISGGACQPVDKRYRLISEVYLVAGISYRSRFVTLRRMATSSVTSSHQLSQHHTLTQCWRIVGPPSATLDQQYANIQARLSSLLRGNIRQMSIVRLM